jgi:hypothetical protein
MAWTASLDVSVGDATKETDYDQLVANVEYLQTLADAEHNFHISSGTGYHKAMTVAGTMTVGVNDAGYDVKFYGDTADKSMLWDTSADELVVIGEVTVGVNDAGHDVKFFGDTADKSMLWDASADKLMIEGNVEVTGTATGFSTPTDNPSFSVWHSASATNVTGDGTAYTIVWGTERWDVGGNFASNTFTAPVAGYYYLMWMVSFTGVTSGMTSARIKMNTSNLALEDRFHPYNLLENNGLTRRVMSSQFFMDEGDTCDVILEVNAGAKVVDMQGSVVNSTFTGFLQQKA